MMLQCHTTGTKNKALGHKDERNTWALIMNNADWIHPYTNTSVRRITGGGGAPAGFYPAGLEYQSAVVNNTAICTENSCHIFSFVTPNWGHCSVPDSTI